ncbi:MAG: hypothetical protein Q8O47_01865 [Candidatus Bathyarchaeota archaeon]|nr:hypothetical protein [Candidatus Bathyarchaeota archaeon]
MKPTSMSDVKIPVLRKIDTENVLRGYGASTVEEECPAVKAGVE